jgi:hypothetical protein
MLNDFDLTDTTFGVAPKQADWAYCLIVDIDGETDYFDGYAIGEKPTVESATYHHSCHHSWVAGMMVVNEEDLDCISELRTVTCERCDAVYGSDIKPAFTVLEFEVGATPHGKHAAQWVPAETD